jgi:hypothetical protein
MRDHFVLGFVLGAGFMIVLAVVVICWRIGAVCWRGRKALR